MIGTITDLIFAVSENGNIYTFPISTSNNVRVAQFGKRSELILDGRPLYNPVRIRNTPVEKRMGFQCKLFSGLLLTSLVNTRNTQCVNRIVFKAKQYDQVIIQLLQSRDKSAGIMKNWFRFSVCLEIVNTHFSVDTCNQVSILMFDEYHRDDRKYATIEFRK